MKEMWLNRAISEAIISEMKRDEKVILMGEDIKNLGGGLSTCIDVPKKFPERCYDMPICESGFSHFANGLAMSGYRPVVDLMFSDFSALAYDAIVNGAAKYRFMTLGNVSVPVVYIMGNGGRGIHGGVGMGCNHSQCCESWFSNVPGLKIVAAFYPNDALGLLRASIRDNDPVLFFFPIGSLGLRGQVEEDEDFVIPLNNAANNIREGSDVSLLAIQSTLPLAVKAAEQLQAENISVELIDPRVLIPLDTDNIFRSIRKTGKLVIVQEAHNRGSFGSEIASQVTEYCFDALKAPIKKIGALNSPIGGLFTEDYMMPHVEDIVNGVREVIKYAE